MSENTKRMLINVDGDETRIAIVTGDTLDNLYIEQNSDDRIVGNIYHGVVVKVQTSFQAAFIDYGADRHGFLSLSDLNLNLFKNSNGKRGKVSIDKLLKPGQSVLVQVTRNELGHKGASLTTNISLPGRFLVFMPNSDKGGVSKKIEDAETRTRLKHLLEGLCGEKDSAIIRTVGVNRSPSELKRDFMVLRRKWNQIQETYDNSSGGQLIYEEEDAVVRTLRDYFNDDISEVLIDHAESFQRSREFFRANIPNKQKRLQFYLGDRSLFPAYGIEEQIEQLSSNHVPLPSGGSIVIDPTEALVAIDVNSGRFNQGSSIEETALKTNLEAAEAVARQLRLRNLGGLIVIDFIDMFVEKHKDTIIKKLEECLQSDKAKWTLGQISQFGLLEMSRQRIANALSQETKTVCPTCGGVGMVQSISSLANAVLREIRELAATENLSEISGKIPVELSNFLFNKKRQQLEELELEFGIRIFLLADPTIEGAQLPKFEIKTRQKSRNMLPDEKTVGEHEKAHSDAKEKKKTRPSRKRGKSKTTEEKTKVADIAAEKELAEEEAPVDTTIAEEAISKEESEATPSVPKEEDAMKGLPPIVPIFSSVHQPPPPNAPKPSPRAVNEERERLRAIAPGTVLYSSTHRDQEENLQTNDGETLGVFLENAKKNRGLEYGDEEPLSLETIAEVEQESIDKEEEPVEMSSAETNLEINTSGVESDAIKLVNETPEEGQVTDQEELSSSEESETSESNLKNEKPLQTELPLEETSESPKETKSKRRSSTKKTPAKRTTTSRSTTKKTSTSTSTRSTRKTKKDSEMEKTEEPVSELQKSEVIGELEESGDVSAASTKGASKKRTTTKRTTTRKTTAKKRVSAEPVQEVTEEPQTTDTEEMPSSEPVKVTKPRATLSTKAKTAASKTPTKRKTTSKKAEAKQETGVEEKSDLSVSSDVQETAEESPKPKSGSTRKPRTTKSTAKRTANASETPMTTDSSEAPVEADTQEEAKPVKKSTTTRKKTTKSTTRSKPRTSTRKKASVSEETPVVSEG